MANIPGESPLGAVERDCEAFKREVENKIKEYSKIDLKSSNRDKAQYKQRLEQAIESLKEYETKSSDLFARIEELKKEAETATLKDFKRRQTNEAKKIKDSQEKIEKALKKLRTDLDKQIKADEKEDAKKNNNAPPSTSTIGKLASAFGVRVDELQKSASQETLSQADDRSSINSKSPRDKSNDKSPFRGIRALISGNKSKSSGSIDKAGAGETPGLQELMREEVKKWNENKDGKPGLQDLMKEEVKKWNNEKAATPGLQELMREEVKKWKSDQGPKTSAQANQEDSEADDPNDDTVSQYQNMIRDQERDENRSPTKKESNENIGAKVILDRKSSKENLAGKKPKPEDAAVKRDDSRNDEEYFDESGEYSFEDEYELDTKFRAIRDFKGEQNDDLPLKKNEIVMYQYTSDPGWWMVKKQNGKDGFVPKDVLELVSEESDRPRERSQPPAEESAGRDTKPWQKAKEKMQKKGLLESGLKASGAVPESFSDSTLGPLVNDPEYSYSKFLNPKLTDSNLNFKNFYWDSKENKIRNKLVAFQKVFMINKCTNIPLPNKDELEILNRNVRICLFDGVQILSNIHTVRAHIIGKDDRTWLFENESLESVSILDGAEFFVRSNLSDNKKLGILFELNIYCKKKSTNEETELASGWVHIPFVDPSTNGQIVNKNYDLILNGGSIHDKDIPLDPTLSRTKNTGPFNQILTRMFKESKIKFSVKDPNNFFFDTLNSLPEPLISSTAVASYMKYYREELGSHLLAPLVEIGSFDVSTEPIHSIFLKTFPTSLSHLDILDAVRIVFGNEKENMKREERNDNTKLRHKFIKIFNEFAYPLIQHSTLPEIELYDHQALEARQTVIDRTLRQYRKEKLLEYLCNDSEQFKPFNVDEVRFELFN